MLSSCRGPPQANVAELADAPDLGSGGGNSVGVQLPPFAPSDPAPMRPRTIARSPFVRLKLQVLKRFIFWDYPRATWQYDVMVGIIVIFVMLTPRGWFRDQPRTPFVSSIAVLPVANGRHGYWGRAGRFAD